MSKKKKKKTKTIYIDDGRTIVDMSATVRRPPLSNSETPNLGRSTGTFRERFQTYFAAVKTMFLPMLATIGVICVAFLILYLILELAS